MAPTPQEVIAEDPPQPTSRPLSGDEVVISGMSGIFPKSNSVSEFMDNLYNKVDMVSSADSRWIFGHPEVPHYIGKVDGMSKFDAQFFRVHYKQGCTMEPMSRKLLEHAYGAIFDSGVNPLQLRGKKVGVFIGSTFSESERIVIYENIQKNGFGITGCNKAMYANRISYWIDGKGPSYALDTACSSSMACLEHAYRSISTGQCEAAIVGGCNLCMNPHVTLSMKRAGFLCLDGKSKCFDKHGDGYVRSDAISVLFLQKAKDAKRIYSQVYHAKGLYGLRTDSQFLSVRHPKDYEDFFRAFYSEINISPQEVEYIEGHGSANAEAESVELQAIAKVFAKDNTVKIGSVVSNMGFSEPASGACALTKVCLAYHKGELPANLHYTEPHDNIPEVKEGKIQVLTENVPFNRGFTALNALSYSGANIHVLLKGHYKKKDFDRYKSSIPHIVLASGRQEECVTKIFENLKKQPVDPEQIRLLHSIHESEIPGHMCRGYVILDTNEEKETVCVAEKIDHYPGKIRPIWFVYSGMGSQWATMGAGLMRIPIFAAAIEKCHKVLEPKGVNIVDILTNPDPKIYDNILHSFVGIAAVQIGLTDILKAIGIVPDNIIGHSVGELGCAYADDCFTAEEMILAAYSRGLVSVQTPFIKGSMAAVGLGYKDVLPLCPPGIEVACHNSSDSSTISGPAETMTEFVGQLTKKSIFAKEVPCSNIAYHSQYIAGAGPALLKYLSEVIKEPKERSSKWVSTSVPEEQWNEPKAKYSSAEYHTNNLLNSVLFEETSKLIPVDAIVIEVAPHGLLQAILKRSLSECTHVPLTRRGNSDPVKYLLEAIGKLYVAGLNLTVDALYPAIEFPVSTETPLLSHLVGWEHSEDWPEARFNSRTKRVASHRTFILSIQDDDYKYYKGHVRHGKNIFPETAVLVLVWETLAMLLEEDYTKLPVVFKNIIFYAEAIINEENPLEFYIVIFKGSNRFEVSCDGMTYASGFIESRKSGTIVFREVEDPIEEEVKINLTKDDVYKLLSRRGFGYKDKFQTIQSSNVNRTAANIKWNDDWVTHLDALLQLTALSKDYEGLLVPKLINSISIDPEKHSEVIEKEGSELSAQYHKFYGITRCGGVEIDKVDFNENPILDQVPDVLETQSFIPHFLTGSVNLNSAIQINLQVVSENVSENEVKLTEMLPESYIDVSKEIEEIVTNIAVDVNMNKIQPETIDLTSLLNQKNVLNESNLFVVHNLLQNKKKMELMHNILPKNSFIMTFEQNTSTISQNYKYFNVISAMTVQNQILVLLKTVNVERDENVIYIPITHDENFSWVPRVQSELQKSGKIVLVSEKQPYCGLIGLVKKLKQEYGNKICLVVIDDHSAPSFHPDNNVYKEQLRKNLVFNILKMGQWGGYYYLPSEKLITIKNATLKSITPGDLDKLTWVEAPEPKRSNTLVEVHYAGISAKDVNRAMGLDKSEEESFGMDFSGLNSKGEKVMGLLPRGALSSTVEADTDLLWPVPDHWTLEEAATVPLPYIHAFYCLTLKGAKIENYHTVFVNGGAGALGQAVISICLSLGCNIYTTVSDMKKKKFLLRLFPELNEDNIGNSRDETFLKMVCLGTKGKLCNYVINTATGPLREAAMKCCSASSMFLDVSNFDMRNNNDFSMFFLCLEKNYVATNMSTIFKPEYVTEKKMISLLITNGIKTGAVRPLSRVVYSPNDVTRAFRLLSASKHRGRVLLKLKDEASNQGLTVVPRMEYSPNETQVVICDGYGLGVELIEHLVQRGARKILVQIKPSALSGLFYTKSLSWQKKGVHIQTFTEDISTEKGCMSLLTQASKLGSTEGIFMVQDVDVGSNESFTPEDVARKFSEFGMAVANLDMMSRNVCDELKYFVLLAKSSDKVTDEYNISVSEKICQIRNDNGLPGLVFRIGELEEFDKNSTASESSSTLSYSAAFSALETSLKLNYKNVRAFNLRKRPDDGFVRKIEKILGVKNIDSISPDLTVKDLDLKELTMEEIIRAIKDTYNACYAMDKLAAVTIGSLKNLGNELKKRMTDFDSGLGAFFKYIDDDEWLATEPIIAMPTRLNGHIEREEELDTQSEFLVMIPGFDGHHNVFSSLSMRLKLQGTVFQLGPDLENLTIPQMAARVLKFVKARFELKSKFYLLGYSFGVNVALELAALLEKEGHVGIVFCLDSSPDSLRVHLDAYVGNSTDTQLQNALATHLYRLMTGEDNKELEKELEKIEHWTEKKEFCMTKLKGQANYSNEYKRSILQAAYGRMILSKEYDPKLRLKSEIVLIKGIPHPKAEKLPEDYNLSKYTQKPVQIYNIEADHSLAPYDSRVTNIVNRLLEPNVLEEFKKKNLCEVYFTDRRKHY